MRRITVLFFLAITTSVTLCAAAVLQLKTGMDVEGPIVETNDDYIIIDFHGVHLRYWRNEITGIDDKEAKSRDTIEIESSGTIAAKGRPKEALSVVEGVHLIVEGDYDNAIILLKDLSESEPHIPGTHNNLAIAYACKGNLTSAITAFQEACAREKGDEIEIIRYNLAYVYILANRLRDARAEARKITSENLRTLLERTLHTRESGLGASMIITASSFPPDTVFFCPQPAREAINDFVHDQLKETEKNNDKAYIIENFPLLFFYKSPLANLNYALGAILKKEFVRAKQYLNDSLNTSAGSSMYQDRVAHAGAYFAQGQIALEEHDYYRARTNFKKAIALFERWGLFHKYLATTYYLLKRYPQSREEFQVALTLLGNDSLEAQEIEEYLETIPQKKY